MPKFEEMTLDATTEAAFKDWLREHDANRDKALRKQYGLDRPGGTLPGGGNPQGGPDFSAVTLSAILRELKEGQAAAMQKYGAFEGAISLPAHIREKIAPTVKAGLFERSSGEGGALVPQQYIPQLQFLPLEAVNLRSYCRVIPVGAPVVQIPRINDTSHANNVFGGVQVYWEAEAGSLQNKQPDFGTVALTARKLTGYSLVTNELLADSAISVDSLLTDLFRAAMAWEENKKIIRGSGAGEPLGLLNSPATISVAKEAGQAATTLIYENIVKMWARVLPALRGRSIWIANPDVQPQLMALSLAIGVAGAPAYLPAGGLSGAPFETLFGRPIIYSEHCSTLGTQGDIFLAAMDMYLIGDRQQLTAAVSEHVAFQTDQTAFRLVERLDGKPWMNSALTPANGTNTLSAFVMLDTRS